MPSLANLDFRDNADYLVNGSSTQGFNGTLPASWGRTRSALQNVYLQHNYIQGTLPAGENFWSHMLTCLLLRKVQRTLFPQLSGKFCNLEADCWPSAASYSCLQMHQSLLSCVSCKLADCFAFTCRVAA